MKRWFKSKTMLAGLAVGILGVFQGTMADAPMEPGVQGLIMAALGALMMFLRSITSDAIGKSDL